MTFRRGLNPCTTINVALETAPSFLTLKEGIEHGSKSLAVKENAELMEATYLWVLFYLLRRQIIKTRTAVIS